MTTTTKPAPKLAGKALYLELVPNPMLTDAQLKQACGWEYASTTKQIILFPELQDDTGRVVPAKMLSRSVSEYSPRAQWGREVVSLHKPKPMEIQKNESAYRGYIYLEEYSREEWAELGEAEKQASKSLAMSTLMKGQLLGQVREDDNWVTLQAWVVRDDKTIVIETTTQDIEELEDYKTPQAVIRRINKVRDTIATYPKKLPVVATTK